MHGWAYIWGVGLINGRHFLFNGNQVSLFMINTKINKNINILTSRLRKVSVYMLLLQAKATHRIRP